MNVSVTSHVANLLKRRLALSAALAGALLLTTPAFAQPDLILAVDGSIPSGTYHDVRILTGITGTLSGPVTVTGTFQVDSAATAVIADVDYIDGNLFRLMPYGRLSLETILGIDGTTSGPIRTNFKDFGTRGRFQFNNVTVPQNLGPQMADEVAELTVNNVFGVSMSKPLAIRERLWLRNGNLITNGHQLTLLSSIPSLPTRSASAVVFNQNGVVIGDVTAQRYISPLFNSGVGYRHFSSSVSGATVADFATAGFTPVVNPQYNTVPYNQRFIAGNVVPYPNTFFYDETQVGTGGPGTYDEVFVQGYQSPNSLSDTLAVTRGYTVRLPANQTVDFIGTLNNDTINTGPLTRGPLNESGWHLVGNPYPSIIDWTLLNRTNMFNQFSKYRSTGVTEGVYDTYVNGVGTGPAGNEFIASNQAVFTRVATPGVPGNIQFTNIARITDFYDISFAPFYRPSPPRPLTRLAIEGANNLHDEAVVYFEQGATTGIDVDFDGFYINGGYPVGIFSQVGPEQLSINGLPALTTTTDYTVALVVNIRTAGTYQINATEMRNMPAGFQVLLQDALTGTTQDLTQNPIYSFTSAGSNASNTRFTVRFRGTSVTGLSVSAESGFEVYPNPVKDSDRLNVVLLGVEAGRNVDAVIYNQLGQKVWASTFHSVLGGVREEVQIHLPLGIYTLQVTLPTGSKQSRRVVVN